jgi:hypothetical protein
MPFRNRGLPCIFTPPVNLAVKTATVQPVFAPKSKRDNAGASIAWPDVGSPGAVLPKPSVSPKTRVSTGSPPPLVGKGWGEGWKPTRSPEDKTIFRLAEKRRPAHGSVTEAVDPRRSVDNALPTPSATSKTPCRYYIL